MDMFVSKVLYAAIFAAMVQYIGAQTVHIVGDGMGWAIPQNSTVSYANWAMGKTFMVGDILGNSLNIFLSNMSIFCDVIFLINNLESWLRTYETKRNDYNVK